MCLFSQRFGVKCGFRLCFIEVGLCSSLPTHNDASTATVIATSLCGWFSSACAYVLDSVVLLPLIPLTLLYRSLYLLLSFFSSFSLPLLFPLSTSGTPTELPSSSDSEEVLPGINTHTQRHIHKLPRQLYPLSFVLPQTSCLSPAAPLLPQMNISRGGTE